MNWHLPVRYRTDEPVFILSEDFHRHQMWIRLLQKYFRINFDTQFCSLIELYQKSELSLTTDLTTASASTLRYVKEVLTLLNWHKKYGIDLEIKLIKENGESQTLPELIQDIYRQLNKKMKYLRWGVYANNYLYHLPEILSLFPKAQFIQINDDHTPSEMSLLFEFEHPVEEWIFSNLEYSKSFLKAKRCISSKQIVSFNSEDLTEKPAETIDILIQFLQIDDAGRQLYRFIMNNIQKELASAPSITNR